MIFTIIFIIVIKGIIITSYHIITISSVYRIIIIIVIIIIIITDLTVVILHRPPAVCLTRGSEILPKPGEAGLHPRVPEAGAGQTGGQAPGAQLQPHEDEVLTSALSIASALLVVIRRSRSVNIRETYIT